MSGSVDSTSSSQNQSPDRAARKAGFLLLLTVIFTVALIYTRVAADADQPTLLESLAAISRRPAMYILSGVARLLSGIALLGAGLLLLQTWIIRGGWATSAVPRLFVLSGALTAVSGGIAVLIAMHPALEAVSVGGASPVPGMSALESMSGLRWLTGAGGFAAAGLALVVASRYQWKVGGALRKVAPISAVLGAAMLFIWFDSAAAFHTVVGTGFLIWLIVIGSMLASGRVERQYTTTYLNES